MLDHVQKQLQRIVFGVNISITSRRVFEKRLLEGKLTRDENPTSHFCVYFSAFDPKSQKVFIGFHKKSRLWLFNGGHMDKGETPMEAIKREMGEEWGMTLPVPKPSLLTLTKIEKPQIQICQWHYDIWYFVAASQASFHPKKELLAKEFSEIGWKSIDEAGRLARDPSTLIALRTIV